MYPFTLTAALYASWEFRVEKILVSQMHPDLFTSSLLVEESQRLSQGSMDISPCSPEFVDPMPDAWSCSFFRDHRPLPGINTGSSIQMIPEVCMCRPRMSRIRYQAAHLSLGFSASTLSIREKRWVKSASVPFE